MPENDNWEYINALLDGVEELGEAPNHILEKSFQVCNYNNEKITLKSLTSILGNVGNAGIDKYFIPESLSIKQNGESIFASEEKPEDVTEFHASIQKDIQVLKDIFNDNLNHSSFRYSLFYLLFSRASRLGFGDSAKKSGTSLFDRNRVLAAVTQCLIKTEGKAEFLLLKGAVSGIQTFMYDNIHAEQIGQADNSAKRLRGRSFMVALFNQVLAEYLIEEFDLEQANILFVGGGHFNLLLPKEEDTLKRLEDLKKSINLQIINKIGLQLGVNIAFKACGDDLGQNFSHYYKEVHLALEKEKQRKHQSYLNELYEATANQNFKDDILIGTQAPYAKYLLEIKGNEKEILEVAKKWDDIDKTPPAIKAFAFLGRVFITIRETNPEKIKNVFSKVKDFLKKEAQVKLKLIALNNTSFLELAQSLKSLDLDIAYGIQFVGNYAPTKNYRKKKQGQAKEDVMLFEDLAKLDEFGNEELGYSQLGVMRLDVDDLGAIFARGLGETASIERIACLSREFQLFFGGFFNKLAEEHHLYITYSGGDDAFVIGSWLNVIHFARALEKAFRKFTCNNEHISFSAGIFLCNPHYPIPRLAKDGEELEDLAKAYEVDNNSIGKNAVALFNHVLPWSRFQNAMSFASKLEQVVPRQDEHLSGKNLRRSMLQRVLRLIQLNRGDLDDFYRTAGHLHGLMARHGHTYRKLYGSKEKLDVAGEIITELLQNYKKDNIEDYLISLNYIINKTRVVNS